MKKVNLLLIEDNDNDAFLVLRIYKKLMPDYTHLRIDNGKDAIEYFVDADKNEAFTLPDMVLLDLKLPYADGFEILKNIRSQEKSRFVPVVVYSSSGQLSDLTQAYELGANGFMVKPTDLAAMRADLSPTFDFWLNKNQRIY